MLATTLKEKSVIAVCSDLRVVQIEYKGDVEYEEGA
jgi:hypothetical protein